MKFRLFLSALPGFATLFLVSSANAADLTTEFDARHKVCLERIAEDADLAFEEAMIWRSEGGGRRAKHCEAMALFAVGHKEEAAFRLDKLAKAPDGGTKDMRADFFSTPKLLISGFWLARRIKPINPPQMGWNSNRTIQIFASPVPAPMR